MSELHSGDCGQETVWRTVENMRQIGDSIESFFSVLELEIKGIEYIHDVSDNTPRDPGTTVGYDWCYASDLRVYGLKKQSPRRGPKPSLGVLTVRVELWREIDDDDSRRWRHAKEPLVLVGFDPNENDPWDKVLLCLDQFGNPKKDKLDGIRVMEGAPWLWAWEGDAVWSERSWFFVVPLSDIRSREDIGTHIVGPVKNLLADESPSNAFRRTCAIRHVKE